MDGHVPSPDLLLPECSSPACLQLTPGLTHNSTPSGFDPIQFTHSCPPWCEWLRPILHPGHPGPSTMLRLLLHHFAAGQPHPLNTNQTETPRFEAHPVQTAPWPILRKEKTIQNLFVYLWNTLEIFQYGYLLMILNNGNVEVKPHPRIILHVTPSKKEKRKP